MDVTPIKIKRDHRRSPEEIEGLMGTKLETPEGDRLAVLVTVVEAWEAKHYQRRPGRRRAPYWARRADHMRSRHTFASVDIIETARGGLTPRQHILRRHRRQIEIRHFRRLPANG